MLFHWFSPFHLSRNIVAELGAAGGTPWFPPEQSHAASETDPQAPDSLLLLYQPPDAILQEPEEMLAGYRQLQQQSGCGRLWRLDRLLNQDRQQWFRLAVVGSAAARPDHDPSDPPEALRALVTLAVLDRVPDILDAYLALEHSGERGGRPADTAYVSRLRQVCTPASLLHGMRARQEGERHREEADLLRDELHAVQAELAHHVGANQHAHQLVQAQQMELQRAVDLLQRRISLDAPGSDPEASTPPTLSCDG